MFDLTALDDAFFADPYPTYQAMREEGRVHELSGGGYLLAHHADLKRVYRETSNFSSDKERQFEPAFGRDSALFEHHTTSLVFRDPPLHTHVRRAIGNALSQRMIVAMQQGVEDVVAGLITKLVDKMAEQREADLVAEFAAAIPIEIIGNLLRIPANERAPLRQWSLAILGALEVNPGEDVLQAGNRAVEEFLTYLEALVARRRDTLSDADDDILARLLRFEHEGQGLSATELYHQCIFLLNAGHETTTNLIGSGIELLLRFPDARRTLRDSPELIDRAVEEMLRFESPNQLGNRLTTCDVDIAGVRIPQGSTLTLVIGAANRDPRVFKAPDTFDITRADNPHLAFGAGIHTCAGLNVARLEAQVAIAAMIRQFPDMHLTEVPERARRARFRGFTALKVALS